MGKYRRFNLLTEFDNLMSFYTADHGHKPCVMCSKSSQRALDELQRTIVDIESKYKAEISRLKKKYETEIRLVQITEWDDKRCTIWFLEIRLVQVLDRDNNRCTVWVLEIRLVQLKLKESKRR